MIFVLKLKTVQSAKAIAASLSENYGYDDIQQSEDDRPFTKICDRLLMSGAIADGLTLALKRPFAQP